MTMTDKVYYEGGYSKGKKHGQGEDHHVHYRYNGDFSAGQRSGVGVCIFAAGKYRGDWFMDKKCGEGVLTINGEYKYTGEFEDDLRHGQGTCHYSTSDKYEGSWERGLRHGPGKMTYEHGPIFEGNFRNDKVVWDEGTEFANEEAYDRRFLPTELPERRRSTRHQINMGIENYRENQIKLEEEDAIRERTQLAEQMIHKSNMAKQRQAINQSAQEKTCSIQ